MGQFVIAWDLETVPDLGAVGRLNGDPSMCEADAEAWLGDKFPKLPLHSIACIGALIAERVDGAWRVRSVGAPHVGERTEAEIICAFVEKLAALRPQLVSFNGHGFDLPVLRYRAMMNSVHAPGLQCRPYFNRYSEDALDLCDVLASFDGRSRVKLDELCRLLGLAGKPDGIDGSQVAAYVRDGRIKEVADYCETDVVNTYRVWLRYELFRGIISPEQFEQSEAALEEYIGAKLAERPHLATLVSPIASRETTKIAGSTTPVLA